MSSDQGDIQIAGTCCLVGMLNATDQQFDGLCCHLIGGLFYGRQLVAFPTGLLHVIESGNKHVINYMLAGFVLEAINQPRAR